MDSYQRQPQLSKYSVNRNRGSPAVSSVVKIKFMRLLYFLFGLLFSFVINAQENYVQINGSTNQQGSRGMVTKKVRVSSTKPAEVTATKPVQLTSTKPVGIPSTRRGRVTAIKSVETPTTKIFKRHSINKSPSF